MNTKKLLQTIQDDLAGIDVVKGDVIPLPSSSGEFRNHFLVNLTLSNNNNLHDLSADQQIKQLRQISLTVFESFRGQVSEEQLSTVVVSVFRKINMIEGQRIYRTRLNVDDLNSVSESSYMDIIMGEESMDSNLRDILTSE